MNHTIFRDYNQDCFEIMLSLIDFNKFKERMINFKKSVDKDLNYGSSQSASTTGSENEAKLLHIDDSDFSTFEKLMAEDVDDKTTGWKKIVDHKMTAKSKFSLTMWQRKQPG